MKTEKIDTHVGDLYSVKIENENERIVIDCLNGDTIHINPRGHIGRFTVTGLMQRATWQTVEKLNASDVATLQDIPERG